MLKVTGTTVHASGYVVSLDARPNQAECWAIRKELDRIKKQGSGITEMMQVFALAELQLSLLERLAVADSPLSSATVAPAMRCSEDDQDDC